MNNNIKSLPKATDEIKASIDALKRNLPMIIELSKLQARLTRSNYTALVGEGFSESEALELCYKINQQ